MNIDKQIVTKQIKLNVGRYDFDRYSSRFAEQIGYACTVLGESKIVYIENHDHHIESRQKYIESLQFNNRKIMMLVCKQSAVTSFVQQSIFKAFADLGYI